MPHSATAAPLAERARDVLLPLALCALVAVGVHAAADVLGSRILGVVDKLDALFDALVSRWSVTAPMVDWVGDPERTFVARAFALCWELAGDLFLALPMLGAGAPGDGPARAKSLWQKTWRRPTTLRITRPLATAAVAVAGAGAVARLTQSTVHFALGTFLGRACAVLALCGLLASFSWRAVLRSAGHADALSDARGLRGARALRSGLAGALFLLPLAWAAVAHGARLSSLLR